MQKECIIARTYQGKKDFSTLGVATRGWWLQKVWLCQYHLETPLENVALCVQTMQTPDSFAKVLNTETVIFCACIAYAQSVNKQCKLCTIVKVLYKNKKEKEGEEWEVCN